MGKNEKTNKKLVLQVEELEEQLVGFFGRKTEAQCIEGFLKHQEAIRKSIPDMLEILPQYPVYGAFALWGHFKFNDSCDKLESLILGSSASLLEEIQTAKSVQVSETALPTWRVIKQDLETACAVIGICFLSTKRVRVRTILNKIKQHQNY